MTKAEMLEHLDKLQRRIYWLLAEVKSLRERLAELEEPHDPRGTKRDS